MPDDNAINFGTLRTRDLVELYFGGRLVTTIRETVVNLTAAGIEVVRQDARRIRYEIFIVNGGVTPFFFLGSQAAVQQGTALTLSVGTLPFEEMRIVRDWMTDGEAVCLQ